MTPFWAGGALLRKFLYKKWRKGWLRKTRLIVFMRMCWLAACTHKKKDDGWGYISMGKVLDNLKDDLDMIVYQPALIHDK